MLSSEIVDLFDEAGRLLAHSFEKRANKSLASSRSGSALKGVRTKMLRGSVNTPMGAVRALGAPSVKSPTASKVVTVKPATSPSISPPTVASVANS